MHHCVQRANWWIWGGGYCCSVLSATFTKLADRVLGTVPDWQTTGQLTPSTGEAGLGHRARLETSNVPFMGHKKTSASLLTTVSPAVLSLHPHPSKAHLSVRKGRQGEGQHRYKQKASCFGWKQKEMQRRKTLPFLFFFLPRPLPSCCSTSERCVLEALSFPVSSPVASGWFCDWSWMDGCRRTGKGGPSERGPADGPRTCRRT